MKEEYGYAVARIRAKETKLLDQGFLDQLLLAADEDACLRLLRDRGWDGSLDESAMLKGEMKKTRALLLELVPDELAFEVFFCQNDYHNLKAAVKECACGIEDEGAYLPDGLISASVIRQAVRDHQWDLLPEGMRQSAQEALRILLQTKDGQRTDCLLDRAALEAVLQAAERTGDEFFSVYGELTVALADIKIAMRAVRLKKDRDFLTFALAPCHSLDKEELIVSALAGEETMITYLGRTAYASGLPALQKGVSAFETWGRDLFMRRIRPQKYQPFGLGPLAAYYLARESEIRAVRLILSAKRNHLPPQWVRERIGEMYV